MDRLDSMRVFLRVAETGSFTKAADLLDMPRATVSAAVQQLEAQLGSRLLHRTTRQVQLTHDGSVVLERCRHLLEDMEELESLFHDGSRASGRLKVDVPSRVARLLIAPALPEFFRQHPDIELELGSSDRSVDLVQEGVDCVLRVGQLGNSSLVARRLGEMQLINCASPAYLEEHGEPRTPADLDRHWAVNYASPSSGRVLPWEYREDGRTLTRALRSRVTVNNAESYIACCLSGLGLIQIPAYDVREHLQRGELREVLPQWRAEAMPAYALYPHRRHLSRRVRAFVDWLEPPCQSPIIVALDFPTREAALALADQLDPKLCRVKVGKELFTSCAAGIVETLRGKGFEVFLDLKFHDIPNTTAMAVKAAAEMGVWMVNVHCSGGLRMMAACRETLEAFSGPRPLLIGVTVLTSMEREDLAGIGLDIEPQEQVLRLAALAQKAGMDGLVCSAQEAPALKAAHPGLQLVTPGIRPAGSAQDDQRRILTPRQALDAGSDYLVIGRPISQAADPAKALAAIVAELG